jgi:hypothetical protein
MIKKEYRKDLTDSEYLPEKLIKKIQDDIFTKQVYEYRTKNNFLLCISLIYHHQVKKSVGLHDYVPLGRNYWKKIFGGDYHEKVIQPLIQSNIVESCDYGYRSFPNKEIDSTKGKQRGRVGIRYRINPNLLNEEWTTINYIDKGSVLNSDKSIINSGKQFVYDVISDKNFFVSIDEKKATGWLVNNATSICNEYLHPEYLKDGLDDLRIEYHEYFNDGHFNTYYGTVKSARFKAELSGKDLFFFKDAIYVADTKEFLKQRVTGLIYHYKKEIQQVIVLPIIDKRSPVTLRLHNHLVNFPSKLLQFITLNNRTIVQLDLRTSQFLIFANLLNQYIIHGEQKLLADFKEDNTRTYLKRLFKVLAKYTNLLPSVGVDFHDEKSGKYSNSDVTLFIRDVFYQDFYSVVQHEIGLGERGFTKQMLFKLVFRRSNKSDILLDKLNKRYPVVMSIIAEFKKVDEIKKANKDVDDSQESNFSVFLQCVEAEIFIDNILKPLRKNGVPCFSRHDSIVVASGYEVEVEKYAKDVFERFGYKYNHKVEDKFWDIADDEELENSGYLDWLYDEDLLNIDAPIEDIYDFSDDEPDNNDTMDEEQKLTCQKLLEIGNQDDYYGLVDIEFLEELTLLPISMVDKNIFYDEIINQRDGFSFFQDDTNFLIRRLVFNIQDGILR